MNQQSATGVPFLGTLADWFLSQAEILMLIRYPYAAGNKDFEFFTSLDAISSRLGELTPRTSVIVFKRPQALIRGVVDQDFITKCLKCIPDGSEYLVVEMVKRHYGKMSWFHHRAGTSHAELEDDLEDSRGTSVAVGLYPDWLHDSEGVASAVVPDENGKVRLAAY